MRPANLTNKMMLRIGITLLFSLLMVAGAYIQIEQTLSPLPIVLSNFFMMLAGLLLGSVWGLISVSVYLLSGALGLPVFSDGSGGIHHLTDFKAGYLLGYLMAVFTVGKISETGQYSMLRDFAALTIGGFVLLGSGMLWMKISLNLSWPIAFQLGVAPFILGAFIKVVFAIVFAKFLRPLLRARIT